MDLQGGDRVRQLAADFPPETFETVRYYLDPSQGVLAPKAPAQVSSTSYDARSEEGCATFKLRADDALELVGYPKVCLWVEADGADDMDVFVILQKLDAQGQTLEQFNIANQGPMMQQLTRKGAAILKYKGSNGRLRASMRHLDVEVSTDTIPAHSFDKVEKLKLGEIVCLELDLFPIGLALHAGELLQQVVSGHNIFGGAMPGTDNVTPQNQGRHIIHCGGDKASFLQLQRNPAGAPVTAP